MKKQFWLIDLPSAAFCGLFIGYEGQRTADSGEFYLDKIIISVSIAASAYLAAAFITYWIGSKTRHRIPQWVQIAVCGSALCALFQNCIYFLIYNWHHIQKYSSLWVEIGDRATAFLVVTLINSVISLLIMGIIHLACYGLSRLRIA